MSTSAVDERAQPRVPFTFSDGQQRAMFATAHNPGPGAESLKGHVTAPGTSGSKLGGGPMNTNATIDIAGLNSQALLPPTGLSPTNAARAVPNAQGGKSNFFHTNDPIGAPTEKSKRRLTYGNEERRQSAEGDGQQKLPEITASHSSHGNRRRKAREEANASNVPVTGQYHGPPSQTFMHTKPFHTQLVGGKESGTFIPMSPKMKPMMYKPMPHSMNNSMGLPISFHQAGLSPPPGQ